MNPSKYKSWDIVVLGGINIDYVVRSHNLPDAGQTVQGDSFYTGPGGKGANQAVAAARLGAKVALIGSVGSEPRGHELVCGLQKNGVDVTHVNFDPKKTSGAAIIAVDKDGEKQISVAPGANGSVTIPQVLMAEERIAASRVLLLQLEVPMATVLKAATLAKKHGTLVLLDPAPPLALPEKLFPLLHVIRPNHDEAQKILGFKIKSLKQSRAAVQSFFAKGVKIVAMEAPGEGDLVASADEEIVLPRLKVKSIDATGAGDAFAGAFAVGLAENLGLRETARLANATAALATTRLGAQEALPFRREVERLLSRTSEI